MSRSEKKVPIIKQGGYGKLGKHLANKKVRNSEVSDNGNYKKVYDRYNIYDIVNNLFKFRKIDGIPRYKYGSKRKLTIEEIMEYWRK